MITIKQKFLPHFDQRDADVDMLVYHSMATGALSGIELLDRCELSTHFIIDYDGTIYTCVEEQNRAWHAGLSSWKGFQNINSRSIGIEVCQQTLGQSPFAEQQIKSLVRLSKDIIKRYNIKPDMIVGHSDIAPTRKADPGKFFPWDALALNSIGVWYGDQCLTGSTSELLKTIGYNVTDEESLQAAAYAFCRHFLPEMVLAEEVSKVMENPYLKNNNILSDAKFIKTLEKVAKSYTLII